ncbi:MAG: Bifunctional protein HldE [Phycisphaerae bacterium]|nr:Bifunctional protein HldE [Phycisphaerae bacterium]
MDHATLWEKFNAAGRPRVVLVGDYMLDEYLYGDAERISPEAPVPVLRIVRSEQRIGGAGGVAADLAALGASVACIGLIGDDEAGRAVRDALADTGCDAGCLIVSADRPTTRKTRLVGLAQHRHPQQLLRVDHEQIAPADDATRGRLVKAALAAVADADAVLLQDYNKGVLSPAVIGQVIAAARKRGLPVLVDPARIADYSRYRGATLITPNRWEASLAAGEQIAELTPDAAGAADTSQLQRVSDRLMAAADLEHVVITLDREGAYWSPRGGAGRHIPTRPRAVYDVTGAGDMVLATLGVAWVSGFDPAEAVALANVAGGLEVERFGSVPITREELGAALFAMDRGNSKLWDPRLLAAEVERLKASGRRVVFTNGCFDILHAGHVQLLQFARQQGDALIVAINSDDSVRRIKGPARPICPQDVRATVLGGLGCVDYVTIFTDDDTPRPLLRTLQPDVLVKGSQYGVQGVVGHEIVLGYGGQVVLAPMVEGESTTGTIERIIRAYEAERKAHA